MSVDLSQLATDAQAGGEMASAAEAALCAHFLPTLRLFGRRHLRDRQAAEDLAHDTLQTVIEALRAGRLDDPNRLGGFVYGVAKNKAREAGRAHARRRRIADELPRPGSYEPAIVGFRYYLFGCLSQLTERARSVLARSYFEQETAPEIADAMGMTTGNVRVTRHRALAALRRCLEGGEP